MREELLRRMPEVKVLDQRLMAVRDSERIFQQVERSGESAGSIDND